MALIMKNAGQKKRPLTVVKATGGELPNILLVDSNLADASQMRQWLEKGAQASLDHASDTAAATRMMAEREWDLVVIDPAVPEGFEFLKRAKSLDRWLAALIVTGRQDPEFLQLAVQARIDGLMFKPVTDAQFTKQALLLAGESRTRRKRQQKRVLAIGAHPDDVEIGCGGALAKHRSKGDLLHILTLSRGAAGGDVNVRVGEAEQAAELLGAKLEFGNVQDGHITEGIETIELIEAAIRELRPTHVYTHSLEDTHQDHRAVHTASLVAARGVPNVYCYQAPSSTVEFSPNRFVDITDFIKAKLTAIGVYKSQVSRSAMLQDDVILATARYWGRYAGHVLAEPMRIIRQRDGEMKPDIAAEQPVVKLVPQSID
jgi:LmbE family N-acetylglucosaminyl deacetylase